MSPIPTLKSDLIETRTPVARFPIYLPLPCVCCGGGIQMTGPSSLKCDGCGATQRKMLHELERLKTVTRPSKTDVERAAAKLIPYSRFGGRHWYDLSASQRRDLEMCVKVALKTLKEGFGGSDRDVQDR